MRRFLYSALALSVFFSLVAGSFSAAIAAVTMRFPADVSIGRIYLLRPGYISDLARNFVEARAYEARGLVRIEDGPMLSLVGNYAMTEHMPFISTLPDTSLVHLDLRKLEISGRDLSNLSHLKGVRQLELDNTDVDDSGLVYLKDMKSLRHLGLSKTLITGSTLSVLSFIPHLEKLDLGRTRLRPEALDALKRFPALRHLKIDECGIGDRQLFAVAKIEGLTSLSLRENKNVSLRGLGYLGRLKVLRSLTFKRGDLSPQEERLLKKMLPQCRIMIEDNNHIDLEIFQPLH